MAEEKLGKKNYVAEKLEKKNHLTVKEALEILQHLPPTDLLMLNGLPVYTKLITSTSTESLLLSEQEKEADKMLEGAIRAARDDLEGTTNCWPWSLANSTSEEFKLRTKTRSFYGPLPVEREEKENEELLLKQIGFSKKEILEMVKKIEKVKEEQKRERGRLISTLSYICDEQLIETTKETNDYGDLFNYEILVDHKEFYDHCEGLHTRLRDYPKCTLLAVLWILGEYNSS